MEKDNKIDESNKWIFSDFSHKLSLLKAQLLENKQVPQEVLEKRERISKLVQQRINDQEWKNKMNYGRQSDIITDAYGSFFIEYNNNHRLMFHIEREYNRSLFMMEIPQEENKSNSEAYYLNHLNFYQYKERNQETMSWVVPEENNQVSPELKYERYNEDLNFLVNLLECDNPVAVDNRNLEHDNISGEILDIQWQIFSKIRDLIHNPSPTLLNLIETWASDWYQCGDVILDGWYTDIELSECRLRFWDVEVYIDGDQMTIYKSNNFFQKSTWVYEDKNIAAHDFVNNIWDKGWFLFDKDVPYVKREEIVIEEDEYDNPKVDEAWNIVTITSSEKSFDAQEYAQVLTATQEFLSRF